ncbi:MAG: hypothetical protein LBG59_01820 [Candidatus Peribacteria bacterium]|jgi:hypothetical protein|nr:hypothetical protein [Candidatus Peribacteria bacterium]
MNICNYTYLDKSEEAIQYFQNHFTEKEILIDKIALKGDKQGLIWTLSLG